MLLPLFPLPDVVLFPGARLPLHIFEPRYRKMISDLLTRAPDERDVGMILALADDDGGVDLVEPGCAGRLVAHEALPDGRSNIVLEGRYRFSIEQEVEGQPYRQAEVSPLEDRVPLIDAERADELRSDLLSLASRLVEQAPEGEVDRATVRELEGLDDLPTLVNRLAATLQLPALRKQTLLAESVLARVGEVTGILRSRVRLLRSLAPYRHLAERASLN